MAFCFVTALLIWILFVLVLIVPDLLYNLMIFEVPLYVCRNS